jgi:hypothetical protein
VRFRTYLDLLAHIHRELRPRTYLEIGVRDGASLTLAMPGTLCHGVDPEPCIDKPTPRRTTIWSMTSDEYFDKVAPPAPWDLAFVDGMHLSEFALRDVLNIERSAHRRTVVLVHDCYPLDERSAERERSTECWSGDVWKTVVALRDARPDLAVHVVDVPPTGLGIITRREETSDNEQRADELARIVDELEYSALEDKAEMLGRVPNDWTQIAALLPAPFRPGGYRLAIGRGMRTPRAYLTTGPRVLASRAKKSVLR